MNDADVGGEGGGGESFAAARVTEDVSSSAFLQVALETHSNHVTALRYRQRRVVHLDADNLVTRQRLAFFADIFTNITGIRCESNTGTGK